MGKIRNRILIDCNTLIDRVVILKNEDIEHLFIERRNFSTNVGNIYKGKITKILSGINAAFVDLGEEKKGFLPVEEFEESYIEETVEEKKVNIYSKNLSYKIGEEVLVQAVKPSFEEKGVKLTTQISIPGRYLVIVPFSYKRGISKKIENTYIKKHLFQILETIIPKNLGFIIRTASQTAKEKYILKEAKYLLNQWSKIYRKTKKFPAPIKVWEELPLPLRIVRDYLSENIEEILVNEETSFKKLRFYAKSFVPEILSKINYYSEKTPIFVKFKIEEKIKKFLENRVELPSGGDIFIEEGETLTAVDVNTGKSRKETIEETIFSTNLEAAEEIPKQIRVRNLSGLIIIDFIDMKKESQRKKILDVLWKNLEDDKARIKILSISKLGLVEMSRERIGHSLSQVLMEKCEKCSGTGKVEKIEWISIELKNQLFSKLKEFPNKKIVVILSEELFEFLKRNQILKLNFSERKKVEFHLSNSLEKGKFEVIVP